MKLKRQHGQGSLDWQHGKCTWRVMLPGRGREPFPLALSITTVGQAEKRREVLVTAKDLLLQAGRLDAGLSLLKELAYTSDPDMIRALQRNIEKLCKGVVSKDIKCITVAEFSRQWYTGELVAKLRDSDKKIVLSKKAAKDREIVFQDEINPHVGHIPLGEFREEDGDTVKEATPAHLDEGTRRLHLGYLFRLFELAVKARHIKVNPLRKGFVPPPKDPRSVAKGFIYPDEEAKLAGCRQVLLKRRVLNALLFREGLRSSEAKTLTKDQIDRVHGTIRLDKTKQGRAGFWDLRKDTLRALCIWMDMNPKSDLLFERVKGNDGAVQFRKHLRWAGVTRPELEERTKQRRRIVWHDTRASFMMVMLSIGKSDAWIRQRTGHGSDDMMNTHYRRPATTVADLHLGDWLPMDDVIPELAEFACRSDEREVESTETVIETRAFQEYIYRAPEGRRHTHAVEVRGQRVVRILCDRVQAVEHLAERSEVTVSTQPTCEVCALRDPRWKESIRRGASQKSTEEWLEIVSTYQESDLSHEAFCAKHQLHPNTFRRWLAEWRKISEVPVRRGVSKKSTEEWLAIVSTFQGSGRSHHEFCTQHGLSSTTFRSWLAEWRKRSKIPVRRGASQQSREEWLQLCATYEATSGQAQSEFCAERKINRHTFREWLVVWRKLKDQPNPSAAEVQITESEVPTSVAEELPVAVVLRSPIAGRLPERGPRGRVMQDRSQNFEGKAPFAAVRTQRGILGAGPDTAGADEAQPIEITPESDAQDGAQERTRRQSSGNPSLGEVAAKLFALLPALVRAGNLVGAGSVRAVGRRLVTPNAEPVAALAEALGQLAQAGVLDGVRVVDEALGEVLKA